KESAEAPPVLLGMLVPSLLCIRYRRSGAADMATSVLYKVAVGCPDSSPSLEPS
ncbi:hypothetical protein V490_08626, partial [Pseudogymnoascus sp. VKM F-3557]